MTSRCDVRSAVRGWGAALLAFGCALVGAAAAEPAGSRAATQVSRPKRVYAARPLAGDAPVIDGRLDDACWREAEGWAGEFTQLTPRHAAAPTHPTRIKILFDRRNLYVAMRAEDDEPGRRSRQAGSRDSLTGDIMGVNFDSYHDRRTGFEFDLTASGQKIDLRLMNDGWDTTWNAVWEGKVSHDEQGWSAEFLIPLSQLRYDPRNAVWGLHAWRWIDRLKEESNWNLLANDDSGYVKSFGELHGMAGLPSARRVEVVPYASGRWQTNPGRDDSTEAKAGFDAKIGLSSNVTLDASVLPDFGQVEADPAVMNLTAFETFLTERRPLFLEGKDIFDFDIGSDRLFYSRRIGQPPGYRPAGIAGDFPGETTLLGAVKVSGKTGGGLSSGTLAAMTDRESVVVEDPAGHREVSVAPRAVNLVVRGQQDLRKGDTIIGGIVTHVRREIDTDELAARLPGRATAAGLDLAHYWHQRMYFLKAHAIASDVRGDPRAIARLQQSSARYFQRPIGGVVEFDPTRGRLAGSGWWISAGKGSGGRWRWNADLAWKGPELEFNDLGFLARTDRVEQDTAVSYIVKEPRRWYRDFAVELAQHNLWTTREEHLATAVDLTGSLNFRNKWSASAGLGLAGEGNDPVALRGGPLLRVPRSWSWSASLGSDSTKRYSAKIYAKGQGAEEDVFGSESIGAKATLRPWPALLLSVQADATRQSDRQRQIAPVATGGPAGGWFVSHLEGRSRSLALRAEWHLRPELSVQYYGNPFGSTVRQAEFRRVVAPSAGRYDARFSAVLPAALAAGRYRIDTDGDGLVDHELADPNANGAIFHSNLVVKWEYRRGSTLYLVWAQQRAGAAEGGAVDAWSALSGLRDRAPSNQVMVKLTYWFSS